VALSENVRLAASGAKSNIVCLQSASFPVIITSAVFAAGGAFAEVTRSSFVADVFSFSFVGLKSALHLWRTIRTWDGGET